MKKKPFIRTNKMEMHRSSRVGWLRAAVLGSDDAIVSTASLMIGVAAASASKEAILVAGVAGLVAGAMSMAVGEYVSVSSQRDAEQADIRVEKGELKRSPGGGITRTGDDLYETGHPKIPRDESGQTIERARPAWRTHAR